MCLCKSHLMSLERFGPWAERVGFFLFRGDSSMKTNNMSKLLATLLVAGGLAAPVAANAGTPVCPSVGYASDCTETITVGSGGALSFAMGPSSATSYDGSDDALIGIINNSGSTVSGIHLSGVTSYGTGIFAFDGDGIATYTGTYSDSTGYAGPGTSFSNITSSSGYYSNNGDVLFKGGLADGATAYFSLEGPTEAGASNITGTVVTSPVPEPKEYLMMLAGLGLIGFVALRRNSMMRAVNFA